MLFFNFCMFKMSNFLYNVGNFCMFKVSDILVGRVSPLFFRLSESPSLSYKGEWVPYFILYSFKKLIKPPSFPLLSHHHFFSVFCSHLVSNMGLSKCNKLDISCLELCYWRKCMKHKSNLCVKQDHKNHQTKNRDCLNFRNIYLTSHQYYPIDLHRNA